MQSDNIKYQGLNFFRLGNSLIDIETNKDKSFVVKISVPFILD